MMYCLRIHQWNPTMICFTSAFYGDGMHRLMVIGSMRNPVNDGYWTRLLRTSVISKIFYRCYPQWRMKFMGDRGCRPKNRRNIGWCAHFWSWRGVSNFWSRIFIVEVAYGIFVLGKSRAILTDHRPLLDSRYRHFSLCCLVGIIAPPWWRCEM